MNVKFARATKIGIRESTADYRIVPKIEPNERFVYIMKDLDTGYFKIGVSDNPYKRLLNVSNPIHPVVLIHYAAGDEVLESSLHDALKDFCVGGEWFSLDDETLARVFTHFMPPYSPERHDMLAYREEFYMGGEGWKINLQ